MDAAARTRMAAMRRAPYDIRFTPPDHARDMGADYASEDHPPTPPGGLSLESTKAWLEGFENAAEQWAEDLLDRAEDARQQRRDLDTKGGEQQP